jgi:hypothetical protein
MYLTEVYTSNIHGLDGKCRPGENNSNGKVMHSQPCRHYSTQAHEEAYGTTARMKVQGIKLQGSTLLAAHKTG